MVEGSRQRLSDTHQSHFPGCHGKLRAAPRTTNTRPEDFADRNSFFRFGNLPHGVDILPEIPGVDFDAAWERRVAATIDPDSGLKAFFISRDDLIAAKLAAARPQDLADVDAIRKAAESVQPTTPKKKTPDPAQDGGPSQN